MSALLDTVNRPGCLLADIAAAPTEPVYPALRSAAPISSGIDDDEDPQRTRVSPWEWTVGLPLQGAP